MADPPNHTSQNKKLHYGGLHEMSNDELVSCCLDNYRPAWDEFFRRFIPCIKFSIRKTLEVAEHYVLACNIDIIWDIHEILVNKLYKHGVLAQCTDITGIKFWLITMAHNQTIDWLRARGRNKKLPERQSEAATGSLSDLVSAESEKTLADYVLVSIDPSPRLSNDSDELVSENEKTCKIADNIIEKIGEIVKPKKKWAMRLCLITYAPLSIDEVEELAHFSPLARGEVLGLLDSMMRAAQKKEQKKEEDKNKAILYLYEIQKIEILLAVKEKAQQEEDQQEIIILHEKLQKKREKREKFLALSKKISRPNNNDIARLIGLPDNKVGQITNIFNRGCKELTK
ncbi:MAG: hypothetical protein Q8K92_17885 [Leadbetterella sp.]|nr:hypothetical protein [Leadbetterella sp.]